MQETLKTGLLSVVLPAYNEESSIPRAAEVICGLLTQADIRHELIFVNDGSRDHTWEAIQKQADRYPQVRGIQFSRNFGKEAALFAGLAQARGDCAVVLDCDLQHPPEKIIDMYRLWQHGYQVIEGVKVSRGKENPLHTLAAKTFYSAISGATGVDMSRASWRGSPSGPSAAWFGTPSPTSPPSPPLPSRLSLCWALWSSCARSCWACIPCGRSSPARRWRALPLSFCSSCSSAAF